MADQTQDVADHGEAVRALLARQLEVLERIDQRLADLQSALESFPEQMGNVGGIFGKLMGMGG